jgi:hypothetical protein
VWRSTAERGVVSVGAVGSRWAGGFRMFRYELRCWREGVIPDLEEAVDSPQRLSDDPDCARRVLELVSEVPTAVWGRDELQTGEMWNSNSVTSWLIVRSGLPLETARLPLNGRAPGWRAGIVVAKRRNGSSRFGGQRRVDPARRATVPSTCSAPARSTPTTR